MRAGYWINLRAICPSKISNFNPWFIILVNGGKISLYSGLRSLGLADADADSEIRITLHELWSWNSL
jgi:hypothetical protein